MKYRSLLYLLVAALFVTSFAVTDLSAQNDMTRDEWEQQMAEYTQQRDELRQQLDALEAEIEELNEQIASKQAEYQACREEILAMVGATEAEIRSLVERIQQLENQVSALERLSDQELLQRRDEVDEVKEAVNELKGNRQTAHPDTYDRLMALDERVNNLLDRLEGMVITYTVGTWSRDRDCLWNIAKKRDIYDNAWLWPRIWQANRDKIRDPDIIHPGQRLQVPPKGDGRMTSGEQDAANRYYREVREGLR